MPVRVEELDAVVPPPARPGSIAARALAFLRENEGYAYSLGELADALGVEPTSLSPQLTRLRQRGVIAHKNGHWHALDERHAAMALAMRSATRVANERLSAEDPKDWMDTPQD